MPLEAITAS